MCKSWFFLPSALPFLMFRFPIFPRMIALFTARSALVENFMPEMHKRNKALGNRPLANSSILIKSLQTACLKLTNEETRQ